MQPYFFPYVGYFQLLMATDVFVFFDDVNFIKRGYIQRNSILQDGKSVRFSVPLHKPSQNQLINETRIKEELFDDWKKKFLRQLQHCYAKTPFYEEVINVVRKVLGAKVDSIAELAIRSIKEVCEYLGTEKDFKKSSEVDYDRRDTAEAKVLNICKQLGATGYINPLGGAALYREEAFTAESILLKFQKPVLEPYAQMSTEFVPALSILDLLFNLSPEQVKTEMEKINLIQSQTAI